MHLYQKIVGQGPPVLILHGLFGMSDNWLAIAKQLADGGFSSYIPDLRNHGRSPHTETHRYTDMCDDLLELMEKQGLQHAYLIGHSMGGKLGMIFSLLHPEKVDKLVVVDMAPSDYRHPNNTFHAHLIHTLLQIDLSNHKERNTLRHEIETLLNNNSLAMFLAKNIGKMKGSNQLYWKFNLPVLQKYLQHLYLGLEELELYAPCPVNTLFIKGNDSDYYLPKHEQDRHFFFPHSEVVGIDGASHWVHSDTPIPLVENIIEFISSTSGEEAVHTD